MDTKESYTHRFDVRDGFVIHAELRTKGRHGELEQLGNFHIILLQENGRRLQSITIPITYSIKAGGVRETTGELTKILAKDG